MRQRVIAALDTMPVRIDTPVLFPAPRGGYIDIEKFRHREWAPAYVPPASTTAGSCANGDEYLELAEHS